MITCSLASCIHINWDKREEGLIYQHQEPPLSNTPDCSFQQTVVIFLNKILRTSNKLIFQFNENYVYYIFILCAVWITVMRLDK
jgi:hypothetical protein